MVCPNLLTVCQWLLFCLFPLFVVVQSHCWVYNQSLPFWLLKWIQIFASHTFISTKLFLDLNVKGVKYCGLDFHSWWFWQLLLSFKPRWDKHLFFLLSKYYLNNGADVLGEAASTWEAQPDVTFHLLIFCPSFCLHRGPCHLPLIAPVVKVCVGVWECVCVSEREGVWVSERVIKDGVWSGSEEFPWGITEAAGLGVKGTTIENSL